MFVGHFAVALAAKRATPRLPLALLFAAVQFLDILWPLFIAVGVEHARIVPGITAASPLDLYDFPYSHSLIMSLSWSVMFALPWLLSKRRREGLVLAGCVFSHFVLDFVTHRPDMQLAPGAPARYGLGLWNHRPAAVAVEGGLFLAAIVLYLRGTKATGRMGTVGFAGLMVVLAAAWLSGTFGPAPPNIEA
ncbi:MAG: hypothetical protein ABUS79_04570, partial [Pseudomonadota bacterium]